MKILVAVITCDRDRKLNKAQRDTCFAHTAGMDVRFFLGGGVIESDDEVILDCPDDYKGLPEKVRKMCAWAVSHGYDYIFKCDSDVYVQMDRLSQAVPVGHDYCGRLRGPSGVYTAPYASGFAYWLSNRAATVLASSTTEDIAEDRACGNILMQAGINCLPDYRYAIVSSVKNAISGFEGPRVDNDIIAACEFAPEGMFEAHRQWISCLSSNPVQPMPKDTPFSDICVLVKTICRDGAMMKCVSLIEQYMPGAKIVVVDDGRESKKKVRFYAELRMKGHAASWLPFDSGFGAKSNAAMKYYDRKYVLVYSDDFEANEDVARGVLAMKSVLEEYSDVAIASGRVDDQPYEALLKEEVRPDGLIDVSLLPVSEEQGVKTTSSGAEFFMCDFTVNYNLIRTDVLKGCKWDEEFKIGGDHFILYKYAKDNGFGVCCVVGASVSQMRHFPGSQDPIYSSLRGRARFSLPRVFEKNRWASFTNLDGVVDTPETVRAWVEARQMVEVVNDNGTINATAIRKASRQQRRNRRNERRQQRIENGSSLRISPKRSSLRRDNTGGRPVAKKGVRSGGKSGRRKRPE